MPTHTSRATSRFKAVLAGCLSAALSVSAFAAADRRNEINSERQELQQRIKTLQNDISKTEASRHDVSDRLRSTEQAISASQQKLHSLSAQRQALEQQIAQTNNQLAELEQHIQARQQDLRVVLQRHASNGESDTLKQMLSGRDPAQISRDVHLMRLLSKSEAQLINNMRADLAQQKILKDELQKKRDALAQIESQQRDERDRLGKQRNDHKTVLNQLSTDLQTRRQTVQALQHDDQRLAKLIDGLNRIAKQKAAEEARREARRKQEAERLAKLEAQKQAKQRGKAGKQTSVAKEEQTAPPEKAATDKVAKQSNEVLPEKQTSRGNFGQLKGQLRLPARGEITHRFGQARPGGGPNWRGVFIHANSGEVRAVAGGDVVFADWLRGYGNLIIIDHGDGYLTIYGNNEGLLKSVGDKINMGDTIATIGNSGGNEESGLYFELRRGGEAQDPMRWAKAQ